MNRIHTIAAGAALALVMTAAPAWAQDEPEGPSLEGEIAVVSDYRYRGVSLSDDNPALQGGLTYSLPGGAYFGTWASTIADYEGADVEVDFLIGWAGSVGGLDLDLGVVMYAYPGGGDVNYWEIPVSASKTWDSLTGTIGFAYAPDQDNLGGDNSYLWTSIEAAPESWPVSIDARLGFEDGAFADSKLDWEIGVARDFGPINLRLSWVDADVDDVDGAVVAGISASF